MQETFHYRTFGTLFSMVIFLGWLVGGTIGGWALMHDQIPSARDSYEKVGIGIAFGVIGILLGVLGFRSLGVWLNERITVRGKGLRWYGPSGRIKMEFDLDDIETVLTQEYRGFDSYRVVTRSGELCFLSSISNCDRLLEIARTKTA